MRYFGKTLEEVLETAERETGRTRDEFIYEVTEEKHRLMRNREVKLEIKGFKQKGRIGIKNGSITYIKGDLPPSIIPGTGVKIIVNGREINGRTYINEFDDVLLKVEDIEPERNIYIKVSDDYMSAVLSIYYRPKKVFNIIDKEMNSETVVEAEVVKEEYPERFTKNEIEKIINEKKLRYGIKWENLSRVIEGGEVVIAEGLPPTEPVDDRIQYFFKTEDEKKPVEKDGKVDYYSIGEIECVEKDQVLAVKSEGKDGKPGYDVYGNIISPKKRRVEKILKGPGCEVLDNGNRAIALIKGMPSLMGGRICVYPVHTVNGDADIKTGNIEFEGDIVIKGSVREGMKVKAGNSVIVAGDADDAEISAGGNVKIGRNAISSIIKAGEKQLSEGQAVEYIIGFMDFLNKLIKSYEELQNTSKIPQNISIGHVLKLLLESKFNTIKNKLTEGNEFIERHCSGEVADVWKKCIGYFRLIENSSIFETSQIHNMINFTQEFVNTFEAVNSSADAVVYYCQNCSIFATNNIEIKGKGCYNTNIYAKNRVIFSGYPGVFRGGQIFAGKEIKAREAGSSAGVLTVLKTTKEGIIEANTAFQNTVLFFDDCVYKIEQPCRLLKAYMQKGELTVEKLKL